MREVRLERREVCFCFEKFLDELLENDEKYLYIGAPPGSGKTTLLLEWSKRKNESFVFIEIEKDDKEPVHLLRTFGEILSRKSVKFEEYYKDIKDFSLKPLFVGFRNALKKSDVPESTYIFTNISNLDEKVEEIVENYLLPIWEIMPKRRIIVEGYEENPSYLPESFRKYNYNYLKIGEENLRKLSEYYGIMLNPEEIWRIINSTNGWILPIIMILSKMREGKDLKRLIEKKDIFKELFSETLETMEDQDKRLLYAISQFVKFNENLVQEILEMKNFEEILKKWERKGIYIEKKYESNTCFYTLNPVFKEVIDDYIFQLKGGEIIYFLLHSKATEYFAKKEDFVSASYHAIKSMRYEEAGKYLFYSVFDFIDSDRSIFLESLFREIGENKIKEIPSLSLCYAIYLCSKKRYEESYNILKNISNKVLGKEKLAWYYYYALSSIYVRNEEPAKDILQTAIELVEKFPVEYLRKDFEKRWYLTIKASLYNLRGILNKRFLKFQEAEEDFKKAITLFEEIGNFRTSNILKNNLAEIWLEIGEVSKCEEMIKELINSKGPWVRIAYLNAALLELVYKENISQAEYYLENYLSLSRKYEIIVGWFYYYSLKFTIEGVYKGDIEMAKRILDEFERFLRKNYIYCWENALFIHKIEFCLLNSNLEEINDYIRLLSSRNISEEDKIFLTYYTALYSYLIGQNRTHIFKRLEEFERKGKIINSIYLTKFSSLVLEDFNEENKARIREKYLEYRKRYVIKT